MQAPPPPAPATLKPKQSGFLQFSGEQELSATAFGRALLESTRRVRAVRENKDKVFTWTCSICESEFSLAGVLPTEPEARNAAKLGPKHDHPNYCHFCLQSWIKAKLDDSADMSSWIDPHSAADCVEIRCLWDKCTSMIDLSVMRSTNAIPAELIKRWDHAILMACLMGMDDLRYCPACQAPSFLALGCSDAQCSSCKYEFCPTCMFPKHAAIRCSAAVYELDPEVQRRFYQERLCNAWKMANTKACPQCHVSIEKNDGCSHMTCKSCQYQFCWICLQKYQGKYVTGAAANGNACPCPPLPAAAAAPPAPAAAARPPAAAGVRP